MSRKPKPRRRATCFETLDLPLPAGPSIATTTSSIGSRCRGVSHSWCSQSSSRAPRGLRRRGARRSGTTLISARPNWAPGRVLEAQVLDVDVELAELAEEAAELAGRVVDHHDDLLEAAVLAVLAGQALDAVVAAADRVGDGAARAGRVGVAQRVGDGGEVGGERVEHVDDGRRRWRRGSAPTVRGRMPRSASCRARPGRRAAASRPARRRTGRRAGSRPAAARARRARRRGRGPRASSRSASRRGRGRGPRRARVGGRGLARRGRPPRGGRRRCRRAPRSLRRARARPADASRCSG